MLFNSGALSHSSRVSCQREKRNTFIHLTARSVIDSCACHSCWKGTHTGLRFGGERNKDEQLRHSVWGSISQKQSCWWLPFYLQPSLRNYIFEQLKLMNIGNLSRNPSIKTTIVSLHKPPTGFIPGRKYASLTFYEKHIVPSDFTPFLKKSCLKVKFNQFFFFFAFGCL